MYPVRLDTLNQKIYILKKENNQMIKLGDEQVQISY